MVSEKGIQYTLTELEDSYIARIWPQSQNFLSYDVYIHPQYPGDTMGSWWAYFAFSIVSTSLSTVMLRRQML